jgi:hypothetical protein
VRDSDVQTGGARQLNATLVKLTACYARARGFCGKSVWKFSWRAAKFPFQTSSAKKLNVTDPPIITVIGKAFFDVGHAPKDQSNRRKDLPDYAAWAIPHSGFRCDFKNFCLKPVLLDRCCRRINTSPPMAPTSAVVVFFSFLRHRLPHIVSL